jgi:hemolysin activation/secretion protein
LPLIARSHVFLLIGLLLVCPWRLVYAAGPSVPSAGLILQEVQPLPIATEAPDANLTIQEKPDAPAPPSIAFRVTKIEITGNTSFSTDQLHALVKDAEGQDLTLADFSKVVARITEYYHNQGFPLARAIVPSQAMVAGALQLQVIEARYDAIVLNNTVLNGQASVGETLLRSALSNIKSGQLIKQAPLDQALLLLSDIPGVVVNATMKPGSKLGATDLEVTATASSAMTSGSSAIDNYGNIYVGGTRVSQSLHIIDPFSRQSGAVLDFFGLSSGAGLNYGRVAYEQVLSGAVTRVGGAYSALQYKIGGPLASSGSHGDAQVFQVRARQSLLRSYTTNLSFQLQYDNTQLRDYLGAYIDNIRHTDKITASLAGYTQDGLWLGGANNWSLSLANGAVSFDNAIAQSANAIIADGRFTKLNGNFSRLQNLNATDSLYVALSLQWANQNLDSSEKMPVGGANNVRAADASALSGDMGSLFTLEYRHRLGAALGGNWQLATFLDSATLQLNKTPFGHNENLAHLSGAGVGLSWYGLKKIMVKAQLAKSLGTASAQLSNSIGSLRGWVEITYNF